ncbi:hypothetical protein [Mycolicibacterium iranicum]|uniref:Uncharacterized protein n=2 Tax=Mycolicibacterium iranicum TaxID=912594 RepID=A0A1X1WFQ4_MYCIR|nr:hypothetical protein [Mycolicibacterium iranicum]ORV85426.1 hypothetical protein AWC12_20105 [Mycolicibacterium iranicum]
MSQGDSMGGRENTSDVPEPYLGIASRWYFWQAIYLWAHNRQPGSETRAPKKWETEAEVFWGARPPEMADDSTLSFAHPSGEFMYYLTEESDVYYLAVEERRVQKRYWMFRLLADAQKYIDCTLSDATQSIRQTDRLWRRWTQLGLNSLVTLTYPDMNKYPGRVSLTVDCEPTDRGWMGKSDAVPFSHAIILSTAELEGVLTSQFPNEALEVAARQAGFPRR